MPQRRALQALDAFAGDQRVAMDAHEALAELVLQRLQRLVQQHFATFVAQGHVLVVGDEEDHLLQRNQLDTLAGARADMAARASAVAGHGWARQRRELHAIGPLGLLQRGSQGLRPYRFDQVADGTDVERLQGELVMRGAEDHRRRRLALAQLGRHLQAIEAGHADVQQDHVRPQAVDQRQRFFAVAGRGLEDTITLEFADHADQALAGKGFVIDDQHIHIARASCMSLEQG